MVRITLSTILAAAVLFGGAGCTGGKFLVSTKDLAAIDMSFGSKQTFPHDQKTVLEALYKVLPGAKLKIEKEVRLKDGTHVIFAEAGPFMLRQGEVARILLVPFKKKKTEVRLITRKKMPSNAVEKKEWQYADQIFVGIATKLRGAGLKDKYKALEE